MRNTSFGRAVKKMLVSQPSVDSIIIMKSIRNLRERRLNSFDSLAQALSILEADELIAAIKLLPFLNRRKSCSVLLSVLKNNHDQLIQLETSKTLGSLNSRSVAKALIVSLRKENVSQVRYWLAYVISCIGDPLACDLLVDILQDCAECVDVRSQTAEGLGYILFKLDRRTISYRRGVRALTDMLDDKHPAIRFWAAFALGNIGAKSAVAKLRQIASNDTGICPGWWPVRVEAADAIGVIEGGAWPERTSVGD